MVFAVVAHVLVAESRWNVTKAYKVRIIEDHVLSDGVTVEYIIIDGCSSIEDCLQWIDKDQENRGTPAKYRIKEKIA